MIAGEPRAAWDIERMALLATVWLPASPERVFSALASDEITSWWVRPGVFDTREWQADVRPNGRWRATGVGGGRPYAIEGEFTEVDPPRRLVHTWTLVGVPVSASTLTYLLEPLEGGTWLTLRQEGFAASATLVATAIGWETSFARLLELLSSEVAAGEATEASRGTRLAP